MKIPATKEEINFYSYLGEALLKTQVVEQALSYSISIKMNPTATKTDADEFLKQQQSYTLGRAIKMAKQHNLYDEVMQVALNTFLKQRNWLIHKVIVGNEDEFNAGKVRMELLQKISQISEQAQILQQQLELDMIAFCTSQGKDMSKITRMIELQAKGIRLQKVKR